MPPYPKRPIIDTLNPCYCPSVSARAYIHSLHRNLEAMTTNNAPSFPLLTRKAVNNPFTRLLAQSLSTPSVEPGDKGILDSDSNASTSTGASTTVSTSSSSLSSSSSSSSSEDESTPSKDSTISGSGFYSVSSHPRTSTTGDKTIADSRSHATALDVGTVISATAANDITTAITLDSSHIDYPLFQRFNGLRDSHLLARPPRKRKELHHDTTGVAGSNSNSDDDSDLRGPSKRTKSALGSVQRSFEVKLKRETLNFRNLPSSSRSGEGGSPPLDSAKDHVREQRLGEIGIQSIQSPGSLLSPRPQAATRLPTSEPSLVAASKANDGKNVPHATSHSNEQLLASIKQVAPMIRIPSNVRDPQALARYLGRNGLLTTPIMSIFGMSDVQEILLGPSLQDHNGLNIGRPDLFRELHRHRMFKSLVRLSCDNVSLKDESIVNLHNLPLQELSLSGTNLTNTAIFTLIPLRHTLVHFSISKNPAINDDAIPALIMFKNLKSLLFEGTHIDMDGLRRFADNVHSENRKLVIEIPLHCQYYLNHMHRYYLLHPTPPLLSIYDHEDIGNLQLAELRKNLVAHSTVNRTILTTGNKAELRLRLSEVLLKREKDLMVKRMYEDGLVMASGDGCGHGRDGRLGFSVVVEDEESDAIGGPVHSDSDE